MATYYWIAGDSLYSGASWRGDTAAGQFWSTTSNSASFAMTMAASVNVVRFTDLMGTITPGYKIKINNVALSGTVATAPVFDSGSTTAGYFTMNAANGIAAISLIGAICSNATPAGANPQTGDTAIINAYSMYSTGYLGWQALSSYNPILANLNMATFRGNLITNAGAGGYLGVSGTITFPPISSNVYDFTSSNFYIIIYSTTVINNNGTIRLSPYCLQADVQYYIDNQSSVPAGIIASALWVNQYTPSPTVVLNLGSSIISASYFTDYTSASWLNAGTSTIYTAFIQNNVGATAYNDVVLIDDLNLNNGVTASGYGGDMSFNTLTLTANRVYFDDISGFNYSANNFNMLMGGDPSVGAQITSYNGTITIVSRTSSGKFPVYIQGTSKSSNAIFGSGVNYISFSPAYTFFSMQQDYTNIGSHNVNIRPSPSPMMMV